MLLLQLLLLPELSVLSVLSTLMLCVEVELIRSRSTQLLTLPLHLWEHLLLLHLLPRNHLVVGHLRLLKRLPPVRLLLGVETLLRDIVRGRRGRPHLVLNLIGRLDSDLILLQPDERRGDEVFGSRG